MDLQSVVSPMVDHDKDDIKAETENEIDSERESPAVASASTEEFKQMDSNMPSDTPDEVKHETLPARV